MSAFRCWVPDFGHDPEDATVMHKPYDAEQAAEMYVARKFVDFDYPKDVEVFVREVADDGETLIGELRVFNVTVETEPVFHASETTRALAEKEPT